MWKPSKPMSLADFASGADSFGGMTFFEELPGSVISADHGKPDKVAKKSGKKKGKKLVKPSNDDDSEETADRTEVTEINTADIPKKKRKKKRKENTEAAATSSEPPAKKQRKNGAPADATPSADPSAVDLAAVIEASGTDVSNWDVLHVPQPLLAGLAELGYEQPTEIQRRCLPAAIRGRMDVVGAAETGSGKTLAFALPVLYGVMKEMQRSAAGAAANRSAVDSDDDSDWPTDDGSAESTPGGPRALILAPTRELAIQVKDHIVAVAKYTGVKVVTVVGGMSEQKQQRLLSRRPEVVVATPGRLWEFIEAGDRFLSDLSRLAFLVVDETDRMLEKGHFQQLHLLLERVNADPERAARRQNFVFSATLTLEQERAKGRDLKQLGELTTGQKLKHITAMIGIRDKNKKVVDITRSVGTATTLTEMAVSCSIPEKDELLYYFALQHPGRTLVFCNSIDCVTRLGRLLSLLEMQPLLLHANMQQRARLKSLQRFQARRCAVLVSTDVAARGLDVPGVEHVIHYQVPRTTDAYVHRSGRTARALSEGLSVMFVEPGEVGAYRKLLRQLNRESDLPPFSVDQDVLRPLARHVALARSINLAEFRQRRAAGSRSWAERAAEQMDIELDDAMRPERDEDAERRTQLEIRSGRAQLKDMLKKRAQVWQPFTRHGRLQVPARNVSALDVAKASVRKKKKGAAAQPSEETTEQETREQPQPEEALAEPADDGEPQSPPPSQKATVAPQSGDGVTENSSQSPGKPRKKSKSLAASTTVAKKATPPSSAKRRRKKKWFARKGK
ncbi:ATP-dependent RNA helicase DDX24-like [Amphibalanus amphitrite]|uniref:ATP-dependent RNA helicase DDX24-like n=1 Tax=Amphibalanus amphitrite TaxID=1232801 RepID=UPI001C90E51C|nr:ATP-dependent RNA helicase DDX24-like [Amphibalanus amphitrite]XP_043222236.1 ATP-dependent RNA helicase DDX24-like [Amphibalanus amphitrite]XP_043222237.1 ATP-dependent RNA helicase DDX24-like [Amphibalanus amphitrite]XP_043222238.1 ATP-dependent RNA helicase DDX24-like [Amphibalanus amphitrite]XP_043222239.1 ATP-dependent RNA helicase DDX24-like [Amphibalanus amphitrite]